MTNEELIAELRGHIREVPLTLLREAADALKAAEKRIAELEAQLPKEGEWIGVNPMVDTEQCSICGWNIITYEFESNYCPYCGARMRNENQTDNV